MHIRAGEILISQDGQYYRVLEVADHCISLMRVSGQTIFACRPSYIDSAFSRATAQVHQVHNDPMCHPSASHLPPGQSLKQALA